MIGKTRKSFLRRTLLPFTAAAATALGVTTAAPREARAEFPVTPEQFAYDVTMNILFTVFGDGLSTVWGGSASVSASEIETEVENIMTDLNAAQYGTAAGYLSTAINTQQSYTESYSAMSCSTLSNTLTSIQDGADYDSAALSAMTGFQGLVGSSSDSYSMTAIAGYSMAASVHLAWLKEEYQINMAMNAKGCQAMTWNGGLSSALKDVSSEAASIASNLRTWAGYFEGQFPTSTWVHTQNNNGTINGAGCSNASYEDDYLVGLRYANYCFTYSPYNSSSTTLCPNSSLSMTSDPTQEDDFQQYDCGSWVTYPSYTTAAALSQVNGSIFLQQMKMYERDNQLGAGFYETLAAFQKIANGSFEYCGNGTCGIGEVGWCTYDCTSTSDGTTTNTFASWAPGSKTTYTTSQDRVLLSYGDYTFWWQNDGNLVLYYTPSGSSSGTAVWSSGTQGTATQLVFDPTDNSTTENEGGLTLLDSDNNVVWQSWSATSASSGDDQTEGTTQMVLLNGDVYLLDSWGVVWWSSASDYHIDNAVSTAPNGGQTGNDRFCISGTTTEYLIWPSTSAADDTNSTYGLVWYNGDLLVQPTSSSLGSNIAWHTNTSGSGNYLCVQEDGNMAIYDTSSTTAIWSTNSGNNGSGTQSSSTLLSKGGLAANSINPNQGLSTTTNGWGGHLVLMGDQLRLLSAAGEPMWSSPWCYSTGACAYDNQVATASLSGTCYSTNTTVLSTEYATLVFQGDGNLVLYDHTSEIFNPTASYGDPSTDTSPSSISTGGSVALWASRARPPSASRTTATSWSTTARRPCGRPARMDTPPTSCSPAATSCSPTPPARRSPRRTRPAPTTTRATRSSTPRPPSEPPARGDPSFPSSLPPLLPASPAPPPGASPPPPRPA
jgi:hypothetical protein